MYCDCEQDGYCPRYNREMYGRNREICRGVNVDLGTAAQFRLLWKAETRSELQRKLVLRSTQNPGDVLVMTAAIYSLHHQHPGRYLTGVDTPYPEVFEYNPDVVATDGEVVEMHYPAIHQCDRRGIHFMQGYCEFLGAALGVPVPLLTNRPHLYFLEAVSTSTYWVVCSSVSELTCKRWGHNSFQRVVDTAPVQFVQVGLEGEKLCNTDSRVGETDLRQLFDLVRGAQGVLCGVSLLMHVAAALEKPCVVVAGGREPVQWNAYPKQHYLHTAGLLPCCRDKACWKAGIDDCEMPVGDVPYCMTLITPEEVVRRIALATEALSL